MKRYLFIFCILLIITPSLNGTGSWKSPQPKRVLTISPEDKIIHLELNAEQNRKKAKSGVVTCVVGGLATTVRCYQNNGKVDKCCILAATLFIGGGVYSAWCAWEKYSNNQESDALKQEYNITIRHTNDAEYLEETAKVKEHKSI